MVLPPMRRGQIDTTVWSFVSSEEPRAGAFKAASVRYVNATRENLSRADADAVRLARQLKGAAQVQNAAKSTLPKIPYTRIFPSHTSLGLIDLQGGVFCLLASVLHR